MEWCQNTRTNACISNTKSHATLDIILVDILQAFHKIVCVAKKIAHSRKELLALLATTDKSSASLNSED